VMIKQSLNATAVLWLPLSVHLLPFCDQHLPNPFTLL
jgi:hypothetical protein